MPNSPNAWPRSGTAVRDDQWDLRGTRSNGSKFTVATLGIYLVHDIEHHLHDVGA